jgi:hypothetical protein
MPVIDSQTQEIVDVEVYSYLGETVRTHRVAHGSLFKDAKKTIALLRGGALTPKFMPLPTKDAPAAVADPAASPVEEPSIVQHEDAGRRRILQAKVDAAEAALEAVSALLAGERLLKFTCVRSDGNS